MRASISILQQTTVDCICREISTMATKRHPNLVVFIAAVIYNRQPNWSHTMMITEILNWHTPSCHLWEENSGFKQAAHVALALHFHKVNHLHEEQNCLDRRCLVNLLMNIAYCTVYSSILHKSSREGTSYKQVSLTDAAYMSSVGIFKAVVKSMSVNPLVH